MPKLALFPLPKTILLPGGLLPLQVFEERYIRLVQDCIACQSIGIIQPEPNHDLQNPPLMAMGCSGRIVRFEEMNSKRYFILLRGERRFHYIDDSQGTAGYRLAEIRWAIETQNPGSEHRIFSDRGIFIANLKQFLEKNGLRVNFSELEQVPDVQLLDTLAMLLPVDSQQKQALLEAENAEARLTVLEDLIHPDEAHRPPDRGH